MSRLNVALIGSGAISGIYLSNMTRRFSVLNVVGCSDIRPERSAARAEEFGIRQMTNEEILSDPSIDIVVNTTYPLAHEQVNRQALLAGKHVFCEKMIAVDWAEGESLCALAKAQGKWLCVAPDTFLGAGIQTARKLIDAGFIGEPMHAQAVVVRGYDLVGEDGGDIPFPFLPGGGIPFDMGGYYLHALIQLLGPLDRVTGFAGIRNKEKPFLNPRNPKFGETWTVQSPNHLAAALSFTGGAYGTLTVLSEVFGELPCIEIYGTEGILRYEDPNLYGDRVYLARKPAQYSHPEFFEIPHTHGFTTDSRGIGPAELAWSILSGRTPRTEASLGLHAFEAIHGIMGGTMYQMQTTLHRPQPLPSGYLSPEIEETALA